MINFFAQLSTAQIIFLSILFVSFVIQQIYYWRVFGRVAFFKKKQNANKTDGVSVIICAHNEDENLRQNLPKILNQNYPLFEVVVVLDNCTDDSDIVLGALKNEYPNLEIRTISRRQGEGNDKKIDNIIGIRAAKYDTLLFTEPFCSPQNGEWLNSMSSNFSDKTKVVIGYTKYKNVPIFARCDLFFRALHYLGMAACGRAYMGDGQNMAYSKQLYFDDCGFNSSITFQREDVVAINKLSKKRNTKIDISENAIMESAQRIGMYNWFFERKRLAKTFKFRGSKNRHPAALESFSRIVFFAAAIVVACQSLIFLCIAAGLFLLRFITCLVVFSKAQKQLQEKGILAFMFLYDIISPFVIMHYKHSTNRDD